MADRAPGGGSRVLRRHPHGHLPNGFFWTKGGYEYPLLWAILCAAIAVRGGGALSVDRALGKEF